MRKFACVVLVLFAFSSCVAVKETPNGYLVERSQGMPDDGITRSLFDDKESKISEENIQKILEGKYTLPPNLRVALVNIEGSSPSNRRFMWNDEDYLASNQQNLATIISNLQAQPRVEKTTLIPNVMLSSTPTFTSIREAAVRMQSDIVLVYSVKKGLYSRYKMFAADEYKAFATIQALIIDVRTGLVPFTTVVTEDYVSKKEKSDFNENEAINRTQEGATLRALDKICSEIDVFLNK